MVSQSRGRGRRASEERVDTLLGRRQDSRLCACTQNIMGRFIAAAVICRILLVSGSSIESIVGAAEHVLERSSFDQSVGRDQRFAIAAGASDLDTEELGVYGEMPLRGMAEVLQHPHISQVLSHSVGHGGPRIVDFGSGAGRLLLGVAAMRPDWASVIGVEALESLHAVAYAAIESAESAGALRPGVASSVHASVLPHEAPTSEALAEADICFMYSTAFPSEDGLRLPELSASLACVMRDGAIVVTTDKFLVGPRFAFEALLPVEGAEGEPIHAFVWRVQGAPAESYDAALQEVAADWMGEDACAQNPEACEALLAALGEFVDDEEDVDV